MVRTMGEFVSNVARLLDETKTKEFLAGVQQGIQQGIQLLLHNLLQSAILKMKN